MIKNCPICNNDAPFVFNKRTVTYNQCDSCRTVFSDPLDNDNMVGGGNEVQRNTEQNQLRIERVNLLTGGIKGQLTKILDFGCGTGYLVKDFRKEGFICDGYDAYNPNFNTLPKKNEYFVCTMIEVIEHLSAPFVELDVINRSLVLGGFLMAETSFVDVAEQEDIPIEDFEYIEPKVGHATILSHHSIDVLMCIKGFVPIKHIDRHVRMYQKIK